MGQHGTTVAGRSRAAVGALLAALLLGVAATACEPPREVRRDRAVIFVHGWNAFGAGSDCNANFGSLESRLRAEGFTGPMVTIAFYDNDRNCDVSLGDWGDVEDSTPWRELSKALSAYVYETYTKKGIPVDLVGHSMGGLIVRGAIKGSSAGEAGFAGPLKVEDAVTLAAPHEGAAWYSTGCLWGQCSQLKPGAGDLRWLAQDGNPQGVGGTEWTVLGSNADDVVPADSALAMLVPDARKVRYSSLEHSDYQSNATSQARIARSLAEPEA